MEGFDEFKNILVGGDESEGAQKAFQYAVKQLEPHYWLPQF